MIAIRRSNSPGLCGITVAGALLASLAGLSGCGKKQAAPAAQPPEVSVATVQRASVPVRSTCRCTNLYVAQVRARVDGIVQKRNFKEAGRQGRRAPLQSIPHRIRPSSTARGFAPKAQSPPALIATAERSKALIGNASANRITTTRSPSDQQSPTSRCTRRSSNRTNQSRLHRCRHAAQRARRISQVTEGAYVRASAATLMTTIQQSIPFSRPQSVERAGLHLRRDIASGKLKINGPNSQSHGDSRGRHVYRSRNAAIHRHHRRSKHGFGHGACTRTKSDYVRCPACSCGTDRSGGGRQRAARAHVAVRTTLKDSDGTRRRCDNKVAPRTVQAAAPSARMGSRRWSERGRKGIVSALESTAGMLVRAVDAPSSSVPASAQQAPSAQQQPSTSQQPAASPQQTASSTQQPVPSQARVTSAR